MKYMLPIFALLISAQFADAQILRRIFHRPASGCANGQCEVAPQFTPVQTIVPPAPVPVAKSEPCPCPKCPANCKECCCEDVPGVARALDGKSFAGALSKQIASKGKLLTLQERHLQRILNGPDSPRRDWQLARMEKHTRVELDIPQAAVVDWSAAVDWPTVIARVLQLLAMLLPLFI